MVRLIPHALPWAILLLVGGPPAPANRAAPPETPPDVPPGSLYERVRSSYPEQIPPFLRAGFRKYDERGENVSVGYNRFFLLTTTACSFTAYFYPAPPARAADDPLAAELLRASQEILRAHPGAKEGAPRPVTAEKKGQTYKGLRVAFQFETEFGAPGRRQAVVSELYLFRDGRRMVKYRVTFPASEEKTEREHLETFLAAFPWPE
jgi:hypothetical protein